MGLKVIFFFSTKDLTTGVLKELNELVLKVFTADPRITFEKVFVEDNPKVTKYYNITATPFTIVGDKRFPGVATADQILRMKGHTLEADSSIQQSPGTVSLVSGTAFTKVLTFVSGLNRSERKVLYITKTYPEALARHYGLDMKEMIWLLPKRVNDSSLPMNDVIKVSRAISDFLDMNEGAVIVIEGLEALVKQNALDMVLDFLKVLKAKVVERKAMAYLLFLPNAIDEMACVEIKNMLQG